MVINVKGVIRDGRLEVQKRFDLDDGTHVEVTVETEADFDEKRRRLERIAGSIGDSTFFDAMADIMRNRGTHDRPRDVDFDGVTPIRSSIFWPLVRGSLKVC